MGDIRGSFLADHENILFATISEFVFPDVRPLATIKINKVFPGIMIHPNEKPIKLIEYLLKVTMKSNAVICDPFMGSGTTAIACLNTNRKYIGFELDKEYFDIAEKRIKENKRIIRRQVL